MEREGKIEQTGLRAKSDGRKYFEDTDGRSCQKDNCFDAPLPVLRSIGGHSSLLKDS